MRNTSTYYRPNYRKFGKAFTFIILSVLVVLYVWFQVFGHLPKRVDFLREQQNIICNSEENRANKKNRKPRRHNAGRGNVVKHEGRSPKIGLSSARSQFCKLPVVVPRYVRKEGIKTPHFPPFVRKKRFSNYKRPFGSREKLGDKQRENRIGLCFKPFKDYRL